MVEFNIPLLSMLCRPRWVGAYEVMHCNAPNPAQTRAVLDASRVRTGLCCLIAGYRERINPLNSCQREQPTSNEINSHRVPAEAAPICEQSIRIAGERAFVNNVMAKPFTAVRLSKTGRMTPLHCSALLKASTIDTNDNSTTRARTLLSWTIINLSWTSVITHRCGIQGGYESQIRRIKL